MSFVVEAYSRLSFQCRGGHDTKYFFSKRNWTNPQSLVSPISYACNIGATQLHACNKDISFPIASRNIHTPCRFRKMTAQGKYIVVRMADLLQTPKMNLEVEGRVNWRGCHGCLRNLKGSRKGVATVRIHQGVISVCNFSLALGCKYTAPHRYLPVVMPATVRTRKAYLKMVRPFRYFIFP